MYCYQTRPSKGSFIKRDRWADTVCLSLNMYTIYNLDYVTALQRKCLNLRALREI